MNDLLKSACDNKIKKIINDNKTENDLHKKKLEKKIQRRDIRLAKLQLSTNNITEKVHDLEHINDKNQHDILLYKDEIATLKRNNILIKKQNVELASDEHTKQEELISEDRHLHELLEQSELAKKNIIQETTKKIENLRNDKKMLKREIKKTSDERDHFEVELHGIEEQLKFKNLKIQNYDENSKEIQNYHESEVIELKKIYENKIDEIKLKALNDINELKLKHMKELTLAKNRNNVNKTSNVRQPVSLRRGRPSVLQQFRMKRVSQMNNNVNNRLQQNRRKKRSVRAPSPEPIMEEEFETKGDVFANLVPKKFVGKKSGKRMWSKFRLAHRVTSGSSSDATKSKSKSPDLSSLLKRTASGLIGTPITPPIIPEENGVQEGNDVQQEKKESNGI